MIGKRISHYKILDELGQGGMGIVYKAEDTRLKRPVALKFLPHDLTRDKEANERFIYEAQAASALDHQNICTVYEIDKNNDGQLFIAMAYYEGETLKAQVARGKLQVPFVIDIAVQIAQGLAKAHEKGIIHRDIKPANIIVQPDGTVKIIDFGLSKLAGVQNITKSGSTMGTIAYMSGEQALGRKVDHRSDIWSLGVVLYEMLTGEQPFKAKYDETVLYLIMNEEPKPVTALRSEVPAELELIVNRALSKKVENRYQHVDDLSTDLQRLKENPADVSVKSRATKRRTTLSPRFSRGLLYVGVALLLILLALGGRDLLTTGHEPIDSIAVLPLKNYSGDPDQEYFSDSMTEELIDKLGRIEALRVISSTSAMRYKETSKPLQEIARELDVAAIVEGSVQPFGERVRIRVRLIDARADEQLWNASFERELRNVLALQREVALAIAREVAVTLTPQDEARLQKAQQVDPEAYDLYVRGLQAQATNTVKREQAIAYFEQAIAIDSSLAPPYAALAIEYAIKSGFNYLPGGEVKARQLVEKALSLDPSLSLAYIAIGVLREVVDWDWAGAEEAFLHAIELNPGDAFAHHELGMLWSRLGRFEEAIAREKQALYLDPLSIRYLSGVAEIYYFGGRYDEVIAEAKKARELYPNSSANSLGLAYFAKGRYEDALSTWGVAPGEESAWFLAVTGRREEALKKIEDEKTQWALEDVHPNILLWIAQDYTALGENAQALDWLERAYQVRLGHLIYVKVEPRFYPLHGEPRFQALLEKMGFPK